MNKHKELLAIGGHFDGQLLSTSGMNGDLLRKTYHEIDNTVAVSPDLEDKDFPDKQAIVYHDAIYELTCIRGAQKIFYFLRYDKLTTDEALAHLLKYQR